MNLPDQLQPMINRPPPPPAPPRGIVSGKSDTPQRIEVAVTYDSETAHAALLAAKQALSEAAMSLRTIAASSGHDLLKHISDVRAFANSRAVATRKSLDQLEAFLAKTSPTGRDGLPH